eukprot:8444395-Ditylum_brightwellii.AAC.1
MSNFQHFDFASDFEQQSAVTIQASLWEFIDQQHHLYQCQIPDYAAQCIHVSSPSSIKPSTMPTSKPPASAVRDKLLLMMQKMEDNLKQDIQYLQQRQTNRCPCHQDHDATTRIQSISPGFIHQKQMITEHTAA